MSQSEIMFWTAILIILVLTLLVVMLLVYAESSLTKKPAKKDSFITQEMKRLGKGGKK